MINSHSAFARRRPDILTEELVAVLSSKAEFEFNSLFEVVHANLRARNAASGGEEMLRLRAYEKLQRLVSEGSVKKKAKKYTGIPSAIAALSLQLESQRASAAAPRSAAVTVAA